MGVAENTGWAIPAQSFPWDMRKGGAGLRRNLYIK